MWISLAKSIYVVNKNKVNAVISYSGACLCGIIIFVLIYGTSVINPTNVNWLLHNGSDLAQHYLGWEAFRKAEWQFPIGLLNNLRYPGYSSIVYTDSIPLFAIVFKVLSPFLPEKFQYFGLYGLLCFVMQGLITTKIVRTCNTNPLVTVIVSAIEIISPIMIFNIFTYELYSIRQYWDIKKL